MKTEVDQSWIVMEMGWGGGRDGEREREIWETALQHAGARGPQSYGNQ